MSVRRAFGSIPAAALLALVAAVPAARAQTPAPRPDVPPPFGQTVVNVALRVTGYPDYSQTLLTLIDLKPQQPLTREAWRRSVDLLMRLGRFDAMRLETQPAPGGVAVTFAAEPRHPVTKLLLLGTAGLQGAVEHRVLDAFGGMPANVAPELVKAAVIEAMSDEGYRHATATVEEATFENPDRKTLTFTIAPGPLAVIGNVQINNPNPAALPPRVVSETGATRGAPFREGEIRDALQRLVNELKAKGYYTASAAAPEAAETPDGRFDVTLTVDPGPLVVLQWEKNGQELSGDIGNYVPARQQNRIDDDLLNDATSHIQNLLRNQGYLEAAAPWTEKLTEDTRVYTFHVTRGPKYFVDRVEIPVGLRLSPAQISALLKVRHGDVLDGARLTPGLYAVTAEYQKLNCYAAQVGFTLDPAPNQPSTPRVTWRVLRLNIVEGAQGKEVKLIFERATAEVPEDDLRAVVYGIKGSPFLVSNDAVVAALKTLYDERGYRNANVQISNSLSSDRTTLTRRIQIDEHKRLTVLDVTVVGQHDVAERQIRELLTLHAGDAFSASAQADSQRKISDMGVFRQVTVQPLDPPGPDDTGVHLIVRVVEAPDMTISYGADLEGGKKPRTAFIDPAGTIKGTVSRLEFAPRGSFGIERRNLGGRNRVLSLYTRVSLRPKDAPDDPLRDGKGYSLSEYRGVLQYRERRLFRTHTDLIFGISTEQAIRTTFNFQRQDASLELQRALKPKLFATFRYTLDFTRLYDERFQQFDDQGNVTDLKLQVDRAFSQVRLSTLSFSLLSDHRDDTVAPSRGHLIGGDTELALRGIGSEVGYTKTFLQAALYRRVTSSKRVVVAGRAQLGVARGFVRPDPTTPGGTIDQIPASQRFFAGGSTTVRGFQLDALGVPGILIDPNLSLGGNGLVILNAELRTTVGRLFHRDFGVVQFVDAGNVFAKAGDISLKDLRASVGFGFRYASPVGPLRLDFGFKTSRHTVNNILESGWEFHLSFGQAF